MQTVMSAKGQVVIPQGTKARQEWAPGTKLDVIETEDGILLRKHKNDKKLSRLGGILYDPSDSTLTIEEINALTDEYESDELM